MAEPSVLRLGSVNVQTTQQRVELLTMLLWGRPACGKTVLAATAPGRKLWLQFDPSGTASLRRSDDVLVADFSGYMPARLQDFQQGGIVEKDLLKLIREQQISTVVADSLTSFGQLALSYGIATGKANRGNFRASIEEPGRTGYGVRSAMVLDFCSMLIRVCADTGTHCIFTAHDQEVMEDDARGEARVKEITISLGGQGRNVIPAKISEIWMLTDDGKQRTVYVRSHALWRPMRTRMFMTPDNKTSFRMTYDQDKQTGEGIADYYERWRAAGFDKIAIPGS